MRGLIQDHGVCDPRNRGEFYAHVGGGGGPVRGVALFGAAALVEADDDATIGEFARFARSLPPPRLVRGRQSVVDRFWAMYGEAAAAPHLLNRELLLVQRPGFECGEAVPHLRAAAAEDLQLLAEVNAMLVTQEGGENPLARDPEGFRRRLAERIGRGRVWLWRVRDRLIFKTDVLAETRGAIYIEGVYVDPQERRRGVGLRCLTQLGRTLLGRADAVCLTVNASNPGAVRFYLKAGYELHCEHTTIYLRQERHTVAA